MSSGVLIYEPADILWPLLDLTGVKVLRWPGRAELVHVDSLRAPLAIRLARAVEKRPDGCWFWTGPVDDDGYPRIKIHQQDIRLNRVVWELHNGIALPDAEVVRHTCDHPPCLNPAHLIRGSVADNNRDRSERGRSSHGEQHYAAKLFAEGVRDIRRRVALGEKRIDLAREYGVSGQLVSRVVLRQIWTDLEDVAS